jgi:general secretion pathway protein K
MRPRFGRFRVGSHSLPLGRPRSREKDPSAGPAQARRDDGYALVAAVTSVLAFAYIAFQVLAADEGGIGAVSARIGQAKLSAAADAGIYFAVHALANPDRGARWSLDGRPHDLDFAGDQLTIVVEDERGKAPLAGLNDAQARALFAGGGATGDRLDALVTEFRNWQQDQDTTSEPATPSDEPVRHGPFRTVGELIGLKDMDPALLAKIAPAVTTFFEETGPFTPEHATPLAIATMNADIEEAETSDEQGGGLTPPPSPTEELGPDDFLQGHTVTVRVTARDRGGARTHRMAIVELTGDRQKPFWIRYVE